MIATPAQFAELNKAHIDAMYALSHTMFDATEKLVDLNLAATKALMEESAERAQAMFGVRDVQELVALTGALAQLPSRKPLPTAAMSTASQAAPAPSSRASSKRRSPRATSASPT